MEGGLCGHPWRPPHPFPFSNKHGSHPRLMQTSSEPGRPEGVILSKRDLDSWVQTPCARLSFSSYSTGSPIKHEPRATDGEPTGPAPPGSALRTKI
ncbi:hypothetical protein CDAR_608911 [Caerostris darwini]|uniref:Uncharacterized protein n=1 Tax=Caerostris darwini TaxID=1538125 RepID=A0AAV4WIW4_9ARAC|nr:hypothetical protein CDAR_608911 [Caerostris darwini]